MREPVGINSKNAQTARVPISPQFSAVDTRRNWWILRGATHFFGLFCGSRKFLPLMADRPTIDRSVVRSIGIGKLAIGHSAPAFRCAEMNMSRSGMEGPDSFPTTNWTVVREAGAEPSLGRRPALGELLRRYWPALWAHLVYRKHVPPDQAEDLIQGFIEKKILQNNLVQIANPERGKFRTILLTALDRYVIDCRRKKSSLRSAADLPTDVSAQPEPDVFGVAWALQVLVQSIRRMQLECSSKERMDLWDIFTGRVLAPLTGAEPVPYELLAERHGLESDKQAANRYHTAEAMFQRNFRDELAGYAGDEIDEELTDLRQILSAAGAEIVERLRIDLWKSLPEVTMSVSVDSRTNRGALTRLFELPAGLTDFAALLQRTLTAPLPAGPDQSAAPSSFGDLLRCPNPPIDLLERVKDFAKENRVDPESPLPPAVATVLYYACIAAALHRCGQRISSHDDDTLRRGFGWCDRPWVNDEIRSLFRDGLESLEGPADRIA
jgi:DNA-directed RNA polymerase specialized sigma24 family protein